MVIYRSGPEHLNGLIATFRHKLTGNLESWSGYLEQCAKKIQKKIMDLKEVFALKSCHVCLYGNQTTSYFDVRPPSLEEYLH